MFLPTQSGLDRGWIILVNNEITDHEYTRRSILILREHGHGTKDKSGY